MGTKALAFLVRDARIEASYRLDVLLRIIGALVSVATFYFIARLFEGAPVAGLERYGGDYFQFVLIGIAFSSLITMSADGLAEVVHEGQHDGTLEILFLSPTPVILSLALALLWPLLWMLGEALLYLLAGALLFEAQLVWHKLPQALLVIALAILANAGIGLINAGFVLVTKRSSPLSRLMDLLVLLLAGVYVPVEALPTWLQALSRLIPTTYAIQALRHLLADSSALQGPRWELLALALFTLLLLPVGLLAFQVAARWAKADGSLAQF
jgi:ABC-2 type transport system permease protein